MPTIIQDRRNIEIINQNIYNIDDIPVFNSINSPVNLNIDNTDIFDLINFPVNLNNINRNNTNRNAERNSGRRFHSSPDDIASQYIIITNGRRYYVSDEYTDDELNELMDLIRRDEYGWHSDRYTIFDIQVSPANELPDGIYHSFDIDNSDTDSDDYWQTIDYGEFEYYSEDGGYL